MHSAEKLVERKDVINTHSNFSRPPRPGTSFLTTTGTSKIATSAVVNRETDLSKELASLKLNSIPQAEGLTSRSTSSSFSDGSSSASTVIDLNVDTQLRLKSMPLPMWSDFDAKVLGMNLKGMVAIQLKNDKINDEFKSLQHSMGKFYLPENPKNNRPISAASLKRDLLVCFERMGVMVRGTIFHVDNKLRFCTLIDVDNYKIHAVNFENILELDKQFNMPAKTIECILDGLELHSITNKYTALNRVLKDLNPNVKGTVVRQSRKIGFAPTVSIKTSGGKDLGKIIHDKLNKSASNLHESSRTAVEGAKKNSSVHKSIDGDLMTPTVVTNIKTKEFNSNKTTVPVPAPAPERDWLKPVAADIESQNAKEKYLPCSKILTKSSAPESARPTFPTPQFGGRTKENQMNEGATNKVSDNKSFEKSNTMPRPPVYDREDYRNESYTTTRWKGTTEGKYQSENKKPTKTNWPAASQIQNSDKWDAFVNGIMLKMQKFSPPSSTSVLTAERGNRVKAQLISVVETKYLLCPYFCDRNSAPTLSPSTGNDAKKELISSSPKASLVGLPEKQVIKCSAVTSAPSVQGQSFDRRLSTAVQEIPIMNASNVPLTPSQIPAPASNIDTSRTVCDESKDGQSCSSWKTNMSLHSVLHNTRSSNLKSASVEMILPLGSEFNAKILGVDVYGYFIIQICDAVNNTQYNSLHASLQDYYSSRHIRALHRLSPTEITNGMIVVARIEKDFVRCKTYDVNVTKGICVLVGLEEHEFYDVEFQDIYEIHDMFKTLPQRAVKCMLKGLESYMLTEEIPEVFALTSLNPPQAHVTVLTDGNNLFLVPAVSMTLENGDDLAEVMKINGRNILRRVQTVEEIQERLALQMQLRYNLLHNNYLTGSGCGSG